MRKVTVKEFARRHKISVYEVIRRIRRGELEGLTLEQDGERIHYVVLDGKEKREADKPEADRPEPGTVAEELALLREEIKRLGDLLARCCSGSGEVRSVAPER